MTWEQKLEALQDIAECSLVMRKPGDWYVSQSVEIGGNGMLSGVYGNGDSPEVAVFDHWYRLTENLKPYEYLVVNAYGDDRKQYRWTGYRWSSVTAKNAKVSA